jgi:hypothetical protein
VNVAAGSNYLMTLKGAMNGPPDTTEPSFMFEPVSIDKHIGLDQLYFIVS